MRLWKMAALASCVALAGMPVAAVAQGDTPSAHDMKGPPNASGFGKHEGMDAGASGKSGAETKGDEGTAASNLKGPPNANGYSK